MSSKTFKPGHPTLLASLASIGAATLFLLNPTQVQAQLEPGTNSSPLQDLQPKDSTDPFSNRGNGTGIFDLLHRSRLGNNRDMNEFNAEQRKNLNDAAAEFRARQRELLQQQAKPAPGTVSPELGGVGPEEITPQPQ